jgi:hypothetical protein
LLILSKRLFRLRYRLAHVAMRASIDEQRRLIDRLKLSEGHGTVRRSILPSKEADEAQIVTMKSGGNAVAHRDPAVLVSVPNLVRIRLSDHDIVSGDAGKRDKARCRLSVSPEKTAVFADEPHRRHPNRTT